MERSIVEVRRPIWYGWPNLWCEGFGEPFVVTERGPVCVICGATVIGWTTDVAADHPDVRTPGGPR